MTTGGNRERKVRWLWLVAALGCGAWPTAVVHAQNTGFEAGLRLGYGIPLGDVTGEGGGGDLADGIEGQIPIILDVGYRVIPQLFVGLYAQYGFGFVGDVIDAACDASSEISCSAHDIRLGIEGHFHFMPGEKLDPWIGLGLGYEWLTLGVEGGGAEVSITASGFEFFNLQAGLDIAASEHFYVGPFLSVSFAQYSDLSVDCSSNNFCDGFGADGDIEETAIHEWLMLGVRGAYTP
jgi:hypothetical protein